MDQMRYESEIDHDLPGVTGGDHSEVPEIDFGEPTPQRKRQTITGITRDGEEIDVMVEDDELEALFYTMFRKKCRTISPECIPWIDTLCTISLKDTDGNIPGVIDITLASKSQLTKFADMCKRMEQIFKPVNEIAASNRAQACKLIGQMLKEDEEGDFTLTDEDGMKRANVKRSEACYVSVKDSAKLVSWLIAEGFENVLKQNYIHGTTLNGLISKFVKEGGGVPIQEDSGIVTYFDPIAKVTKVFDVAGIWEASSNFMEN